MAATYKINQIKRGDEGNDVLLLQEILKARGIYKGGLDRKFGPATEKAVSEKHPTLYHELRYVDPDGYVWYPAVITVAGKGIQRVSVLSVEGKLLKVIEINENECRIEGLMNGVYLLKIDTENGVIVNKIVKL